MCLLQHQRIVLLTEGHSNFFVAKTAISLLRYRGPAVIGVWDSEHRGKTAFDLFQIGSGVPVISDWDQVERPDAIYIGIAPPGGKFPHRWRPIIQQALLRGIDVVSGLHDFLAYDPEFAHLSQQHGGQIIDVRYNQFAQTAKAPNWPTSCLRIHTVGHDCSVGKMVVTLELERELAGRGQDAKFIATGQTGIMISGSGLPIDCIVGDFISGAAEALVDQNQHHEFLLIEGQGSISHPAYAAVTLGLLHGSAPQGLIYCYEAGRERVKGLDHVPIPDRRQQMDAFLQMANLRHPCQWVGVAVNTRTMDSAAAAKEIAQAEQALGLPTCDVYRDGATKLADAVIHLKQQHNSQHETQTA